MAKNSIHIKFSRKEFDYLSKKAALKNKTLWKLLQSDINKAFESFTPGIPDICADTDKERISRVIQLPNRLWRTILCLSKQVGVTPTQLVYRIVVAPHLMEILKEGVLEASVVIPD